VTASSRWQADLLDELEQLWLRRPRITQQQNIDIPSQPHPIRQDLLAPTHKQARHRLLDVHIPIDTRCHTAGEAFVQTVGTCHLLKLLFFLGGEDAGAGRGGERGVELDTEYAEVGLAESRSAGRIFLGGFISCWGISRRKPRLTLFEGEKVE